MPSSVVNRLLNACRFAKDPLGKGAGGVNANRSLPGLVKKEDWSRILNLSRKPILECLICGRRCSVEETCRGHYRLETMICVWCYQARQQADFPEDCFGKPTTREGAKRLLGYNPEARECKTLCPDRAVCRLVVCGPSAKT
jgi:hypothetical protein